MEEGDLEGGEGEDGSKGIVNSDVGDGVFYGRRIGYWRRGGQKRFEGDGRVEVYLLLLDVASEIEFIGFAVVV